LKTAIPHYSRGIIVPPNIPGIILGMAPLQRSTWSRPVAPVEMRAVAMRANAISAGKLKPALRMRKAEIKTGETTTNPSNLTAFAPNPHLDP
jgi:hypothetical protein